MCWIILATIALGMKGWKALVGRLTLQSLLLRFCAAHVGVAVVSGKKGTLITKLFSYALMRPRIMMNTGMVVSGIITM